MATVPLVVVTANELEACSGVPGHILSNRSPDVQKRSISCGDCAVCEDGYASGFQCSCRSCIGSDNKWLAIGTLVCLLDVVLAVMALVVLFAWLAT